ncbi:hypothetical protein D1872_232290 [compost metagenome]
MAEFVQRGNHWKHDAQVAIYTCPKQSSKLCAENIRPIQTKSNRSEAEERIHFFWQIQIWKLLVTANIQRSYHNRLAFHFLKHSLVSVKLNILGGKLCTTHIEKFRTVQTYTLAAIIQYTIHIIWSTDIGSQLHMNAILGGCSYLLQFLPLRDLTQMIVAFLLILFQYLRSWIHNNRTVKTIYNYNVVLIYFGQHLFCSNNCRNFKRTCHNCGVGSSTANIGSKTLNISTI